MSSPSLGGVQAEVHWQPLGDDGAEILSLGKEIEPTHSKNPSNARTLILLLGFLVIFGSFLEYPKITFGPPRS